MSKISKAAAAAFMAGKPFKKGNTEIFVSSDCTIYFLHGNRIAHRDASGIHVSTAGWNTRTTRSRLNDLPNVQVYNRSFALYLNGQPWDGTLTQVSNY